MKSDPPYSTLRQGHRIDLAEVSPLPASLAIYAHYFTATSLLSLCHRSGLHASRLTSGHFESSVYPDSLRVVAQPRVSASSRREMLLERFRAICPGHFSVYGIGGDFHNYVEPVLEALPVVALIDSDPRRHGERIGSLTVSGFDPERHAQFPVLVASVRFKDAIAAWLCSEHRFSPDRILGLDDVYGDASRTVAQRRA